MSKEQTYIQIWDAREHNLKGVDVRIPHNKMTVVTGVSGSGKSSLAFDTLYAEGQRRYMETFSSYARQFIGEMERPEALSVMEQYYISPRGKRYDPDNTILYHEHTRARSGYQDLPQGIQGTENTRRLRTVLFGQCLGNHRFCRS